MVIEKIVNDPVSLHARMMHKIDELNHTQPTSSGQTLLKKLTQFNYSIGAASLGVGALAQETFVAFLGCFFVTAKLSIFTIRVLSRRKNLLENRYRSLPGKERSITQIRKIVAQATGVGSSLFVGSLFFWNKGTEWDVTFKKKLGVWAVKPHQPDAQESTKAAWTLNKNSVRPIHTPSPKRFPTPPSHTQPPPPPPPPKPKPNRGLKGKYGFLTDYSNKTEQEAREVIKKMWNLGIKEFQFYDWFAGYSTPIRGDSWRDPFFGKQKIHLQTIRTYIQQIKELGGCAWAYVQAVGAEENGLKDESGNVYKPLLDEHNKNMHEGKFYTYCANTAWADRMLNIWLKQIKELGFTGIHWDTLGRIAENYGEETIGFHNFLERTFERLKKEGLEQTANFVDAAWWDEDIIKKYVAFPYVEVWSEDNKIKYYDQLKKLFSTNSYKDDQLRAVIAHYPGDKVSDQEAKLLISMRSEEAQQHGVSYLIWGDGNKRLVTCYFPCAVPV